MLVTQDAYERARQRVAMDQAAEGRMRVGWARQGLTPGAIDTMMAPIRSIHAEAEASVQAYEQRLAHGSSGAAHG